MIARIAGDKVQLPTIVGGERGLRTLSPTAADARAVLRRRDCSSLRPQSAVRALGPAPVEAGGVSHGTKLVAAQGGNVIIDDRPRAPSRPAGFFPPKKISTPGDPPTGLVYVANIAEGLAQLDLATAASIGAGDGYSRELPCARRLGAERTPAIPSAKAARHHLHDAFEYLARAMTSR